MKNIIFLLFYFIINISFAQELTQKERLEYLSNNQYKLTPKQIISTFKEAKNIWLDFEDNPNPVSFESAYNLNVFKYFNLTETYNSELQRSVFKKTNEYKILLDSLTKIKNDYLNSVYFQYDFNSVSGETFDMGSKNDDNGFQVNYDIQKKGFNIGIGEVLPYHCLNSFCPNVIEQVEFKQLKTTKKFNLIGNSKNSYTQYIFIPMDEGNALEIEKNRTQIGIIRIFNITGIYSATFNDKEFLADNYGKTCKAKVVKGGNIRILIYNKVANQVYFDCLYLSKQK